MLRMEAEAVMSIIGKCEIGEWEFCTSDVLFDEIDNNTNFIRKRKLLMLFQSANGKNIDLTDEIVTRAKQLERFNIKPYDALHLACAEAEGVDVFLTTDRKLIKATTRSDTAVKVKNPLIWLTEVLYDE